MNLLKEQSLISELEQICTRLGDAAAGINVDPGASKATIDSIFTDLADLRGRIEDQTAANS